MSTPDSHSVVEQFNVAEGDFTTRPVIMGRKGVVTSGHYLATGIGMRALEKGGNAMDATAAMGFALTVLEPQINGIGGEVPILVYSAKEEKAFAISGQGWAPKAMTIDWFRTNDLSIIPGDGLLPAMVPASVDAWIQLVARFGKLTLADVLGPAVELARDGFPMYPGLQNGISSNASRFREEWPTSAEIFLPGDEVPDVGQNFIQSDWANSFQKLLDAESANSSKSREAALQAARDEFYKGDITKRVEEFAQGNEFRDATGRSHSGFISYDDFAGYEGAVEEPWNTNYRGLEVHKCPSWTQGPVQLQLLNLLEGYDLASMGHNSVDYIHTWIECAKLAFADRESHYGDPRFVDVPAGRLLSKDYAAERRELIDPEKADCSEPRPGSENDGLPAPVSSDLGTGFDHDTTHLDAIDGEGNMVAATPSGGWIPSSPVVAGLGFPLGTRGQMFSLNPDHPNSLQPGKRPRTTLTPSLVTKDGRPFMVYGTPGGDQQDQWTNQYFLSFVDFGMNVQAALDAPTFHSQHFPGSFFPRSSKPGHMVVESRIPESVRNELESRGHIVNVSGDWSHGRCLAIWRDEKTGTIYGGASPRLGTGYAMGW